MIIIGNITNDDNIIKLDTVDKLKLFRDNVNSGNDYENKVVYLSNNLELNESEEWIPIGNENNYFNGIFEGSGNIVSNICINENNDYSGFFGANSGTIKNLSVSGNIKGKDYVGGICARNENGKISNCKNYVSINSTGIHVGGIVGRNNSKGSVSNCSNNVEIRGNQYIGGIVGLSNGGTIDTSFNVGAVSGEYQVGGILGYSGKNTKVKNCYNMGNIKGTYFGIGGIVGLNADECVVSKSYNYSEVQGKSAYGMITGRNDYIVSDCYYISEIDCDGYQNENANYLVQKITLDFVTSKQFVQELNGGQLENVWKMDESNINNGCPILNWQ